MLQMLRHVHTHVQKLSKKEKHLINHRMNSIEHNLFTTNGTTIVC